MKFAREHTDPIVIEDVRPEVDGGRFPVKWVAGETFTVEADIYKDGHECVLAVLLFREESDENWQTVPMTPLDNDRWRATFTPPKNARYIYTIEAWVDPVLTWLKDAEKKCLARDLSSGDIMEGTALFEKIWVRAHGEERERIRERIKMLNLPHITHEEMISIIQSPDLRETASKYVTKQLTTFYAKELVLVADRVKAQFGAWYELFPRSQGAISGQSGTFRDCIRRLDEIEMMGFDVIYLAPIHPIGTTNRKGPNNTLKADRNAPGSPWAIGSPEGGHKAIHPELGTLEDFRDFVSASRERGIEIALDIAFQCSPDHPYAREHPEWFYRLPDKSIRYAENPPKKYQDIYPLNFHCEDYPALWNELKSILVFWMEQGVRIFRVDNPHTKPLRFWRWLIEEIQKIDPGVIFLSEAFTRPKIMKFLAKAGFTQSYTYFTWRNSKWDLRQYLEELTQTDMKYTFRPNFFTNTPDILTEILQKGGRPAFKMRLVLAATLASSYGIYSSYELCENRAKEPGSEDYLNSEKYEHKVWDWDRPGHIKDFVALINRIRKENPALQSYLNLEFYDSGNDQILAYGKRTPDNSNMIVCIVNLDPYRIQDDVITLPLWKFGLEEWQTYRARDLVTGAWYDWKGGKNYVRLDPHAEPAHIFRIEK